MDKEKKRKVPSTLSMLLDVDIELTRSFCSYVEVWFPQLSRTHLKALEISCHGIPWIVLWGIFIMLWNDPSLYQIQINLMFGLFLDIVAVAIIKAIARRRRPPSNKSDMFIAVGPDKYSFPSGHASRAAYIAHFFIFYLDLNALWQLILLSWSTSVCFSRVALRRHHLLDVLFGAILGLIESYIVGLMWLSQDTCVWILSSFKD